MNFEAGKLVDFETMAAAHTQTHKSKKQHNMALYIYLII